MAGSRLAICSGRGLMKSADSMQSIFIHCNMPDKLAYAVISDVTISPSDWSPILDTRLTATKLQLQTVWL